MDRTRSLGFVLPVENFAVSFVVFGSDTVEIDVNVVVVVLVVEPFDGLPKFVSLRWSCHYFLMCSLTFS